MGKTGRLSGFSVCLPSYLFFSLPCPIFIPEADLFGKHHLGSPQLVSIWVLTMEASTGDWRQEERELGYILSILSLLGAKDLAVAVSLQLWLLTRGFSSMAPAHRALEMLPSLAL